MPERRDGGLHRSEDGNATISVLRGQEPAVASDEDRDDRLAWCRRVGDRNRNRIGIGDERRRVDDDRAIDGGVVQHGRDRSGIAVRVGVAEKVDGVLDRCRRRQTLA